MATMGLSPPSARAASRLMAKAAPSAAATPSSLPQKRTAMMAAPDRQTEAYRRSMAVNLKREWKVGDLYAPHDLSAAEMRKWAKKQQPTTDVFDALNVDPLSLYKNFSVMSDFISDMGRIRPASETGLRPVNQRKISKAVRRAVAVGLMPSVHKHPEILKAEQAERPKR